MRYISVGGGILLIFMGLLIFLDRFVVLTDSFTFLPGAAENAAATDGNITGTFGFGVAFVDHDPQTDGRALDRPSVFPPTWDYRVRLSGSVARGPRPAPDPAAGPPARLCRGTHP